MSEDILHCLCATKQNPDIQFTSNVYNEALVLTDGICLAIANKALVQLGMAAPNRSANDLFDRDLQRETHFDVDELGTFVQTNLLKLVPGQRIVYDKQNFSYFRKFGNHTITKKYCTGNRIIWNCGNPFGWWPNSAFSTEISIEYANH
ncbi:hypothetical protein PR048_017451 [Dryococelus australis]|uniref:Uncharacterized protein n=1 Tax=Dryococelus australis TaxID=614101 RepID=A0ABQ9H9J3_9NEOP|nr:hypothetical protein PR048_017451 [Dryococelus australis]